jgi:hypothetical protein
MTVKPEPKRKLDIRLLPLGAPTQPANIQPKLSESDTRALARLVRKYGPEAVIAEATMVSPRRPGRPSRGSLPYEERMNPADWFEDRVSDYRENGSRKPIMEAEIELYELMYSGEENPPDFMKFRKTLKKKRLQGRRELREFEQKCAECERLSCDRSLRRMLGLPLRGARQRGTGELVRRQARLGVERSTGGGPVPAVQYARSADQRAASQVADACRRPAWRHSLRHAGLRSL